jgi:hypothetical protein
MKPARAKVMNEWIYTSTPPPGFLQCEGPISVYFVIFQASPTVQLRPSLFCDVDAAKVDSFWRRFATCRTDMLYRNVGKQVPTQYVQLHRMAEASVYIPQHEVCVCVCAHEVW